VIDFRKNVGWVSKFLKVERATRKDGKVACSLKIRAKIISF